jgi:hypothetical protein
MQRHLRRALTISIYPLLGLAGLLAVSGCAAVPAISMASSLLKPTQPAQPVQPAAPGAAAPAPDIFSSLAQRLGITLPPLPAANPGTAQTQTDAPSVDMPAKTATASR